MNEIEKLYENAGIGKTKCNCNLCPLDIQTCGRVFGKCPYYYPPFTAEKQIAIENIIFQCNFGFCELRRTMPAEFTKDNRFVKLYFSWLYYAGDIGYYDEITGESFGDWEVEYSNPDRKEALAGFVNALWNEYLTTEKSNK